MVFQLEPTELGLRREFKFGVVTNLVCQVGKGRIDIEFRELKAVASFTAAETAAMAVGAGTTALVLPFSTLTLSVAGGATSNDSAASSMFVGTG